MTINSGSTGNSAVTQSNAAHATKTPKTGAASQKQREDFQQKLLERENRGSGSDTGKTSSEKSGTQLHPLAGKQRQEEKQKDRDPASGMFGGASQAVNNGGIAAATPSSAGLDPALLAQIERIAAAIAEQSGKGKQAEFTLQLPGGSPIESAVLARSATGYVSVLLTARPGTLNRHERKLIGQALSERMKNKAVRLNEIGFAGKAG